MLDHILTSFLFFFPSMSGCYLCGRPGTSAGTAIVQETLPLQAATFKPFIARWRSFGIFAIVYIDDGIFACRSLLHAQSASKLVGSDLQLSGWKSNWELRQLGEWLGIIVDTIRILFIVLEKKIVKVSFDWSY